MGVTEVGALPHPRARRRGSLAYAEDGRTGEDLLPASRLDSVMAHKFHLCIFFFFFSTSKYKLAAAPARQEMRARVNTPLLIACSSCRRQPLIAFPVHRGTSSPNTAYLLLFFFVVLRCRTLCCTCGGMRGGEEVRVGVGVRCDAARCCHSSPERSGKDEGGGDDYGRLPVCLPGPSVFIKAACCSLNLPCFLSALVFFSPALTDSLCSALPVVSPPCPPACPPPSGSLALVYLPSLKASDTSSLLQIFFTRHLFSCLPGGFFFSLSQLARSISLLLRVPAALSSQSSPSLLLLLSYCFHIF